MRQALLAWNPILAGVSLAIGLLVPSLFELLQKPASRRRHINLEVTAVIVLTLTALVCLVFSLLCRRRVEPEHKKGPSRSWKFGLVHLFFAMTALAVALAIVPRLESWVVSSLIVAIIVAVTAGPFRRGDATGWRMATLLACMFLPFAWMIAYGLPFGHTSGVASAIPIAPGILVAELLRGLAGLPRGMAETIAALAAMIQLFLGAWLAGQGPRGSLAYALLTLAASSAGSLLLHVLYRA